MCLYAASPVSSPSDSKVSLELEISKLSMPPFVMPWTSMSKVAALNWPANRIRQRQREKKVFLHHTSPSVFSLNVLLYNF